MGPLFLRPEFVPDGEGGIDIEWVNGDKKMTLSCRGSSTQNDYIYWEQGGEYEAKDISFSRLASQYAYSAKPCMIDAPPAPLPPYECKQIATVPRRVPIGSNKKAQSENKPFIYAKITIQTACHAPRLKLIAPAI